MFPAETTILIVDDMETERKRLRFLLTELGYSHFLEASDGNIGFRVLEENASTIGLVLSDLNMPHCTGVELLKKIRGSTQFSTIPFVIFSTESERGVIIDAMTAGCSGYLIKPVQIDALKTKLSKVYERYSKEGKGTPA